MSLLRIIRITATTIFDGATLLTTEYVPENNPKQPVVSVTQAQIGRLSFKSLLRSGTVGGLFRIRTYGIVGLTASLVSLSADENAQLATPDDPAPSGVNTELESISLTSQWSDVYQAGPADAIEFVGPRGTVEIAIADADSEDLLRHWAAVASRPPTPPIQFLTVTEDTTLQAWAGDLYIIFEPATPGVVLTLPLANAMVNNMQARLHVARRGGSWGTIDANAADSINGGSTLLMGEAKETIIELLAGAWIAIDPPIITDLVVTNASLGGKQTLPVIYGTRIISINYSAFGYLELPPIDDVPHEATYILQRTGDSTASPPIPAQCKLITDDAGDTMDGVADDARYLGPLGSTMIIRRSAGGWITVGNRQDIPDQNILVTGTSYDFGSGWVGTKYVRSTAAGATTIGCPPAANTPIGCRLVMVGEGAGGVTLSADANIIAAGASASTLVAAKWTPKAIEFNGTNWIAT